MNSTARTVETAINHARTVEKAHVLILCSSDLHLQDIVERLRQSGVELYPSDGDYVGELANFHGGNSTITVRPTHL